MTQRGLWWLASVLLAGLILLLGRSCGRDAALTTSVERPTIPASPAESGSASAQAPSARAQAVADQRQRTMTAAVDTLHRYLAALGGQNRALADAFWVGDRPPAQSNEADLRTLQGLRALRVQNRTPRPLDSGPVPAALEIPVELRISTQDLSGRRYRGWYRLRSSSPVEGEWEITSASVRVETR
jgi:hypothetical protein